MREGTEIGDRDRFLSALFAAMLYLSGCASEPAEDSQNLVARAPNAASDISRRNRTGFYAESSAGQLSTCGIAFTGIDSDWNFFEGAYGFRLSEDQKLVPFFRLRSFPSSPNDSGVSGSINNAWIRSAENTTVDGDWLRMEETDGFMLIGKSTDQGAGLYFDLIGGEAVSVGFSHESESSYRVYELRKFPASQEAEACSCMARMRSQSLGQ